MLDAIKISLSRQSVKTLQRSVLTGTAIIALLLLSLMLSARDFFLHNRASHEQQYQKLFWMNSQKIEIEAFRTKVEAEKVTSNESLISTVTHSAEQRGIALSHYRPDGDFSVQVSTENSPLRETLDWISTLQSDHHLTVDSMSLSRGIEKGLGKLKIEFRSSRIENR